MYDPSHPEVGHWYQNTDKLCFEVVALDEDSGTVEIQFFDGSLEEYDLDLWPGMQLSEIEPPEDWSGSYDIQPDDYGVDLDLPMEFSSDMLWKFE